MSKSPTAERPRWQIRGGEPTAISYSAPLESWDEAVARSAGYDAPQVLARVRAAALKVRNGEAVYECDGLAHDVLRLRWALNAALLRAFVSRARDRAVPFHVLDFGGSLASVYFQNRPMLACIPALLWSVVELPAVVACGNAEFADSRLHFYTSMAEAAARAPVDVALFSGSLEYIGAPYALIDEAASFAPSHIVLDTLHLSESGRDEFRLQTVTEPYYPATLAVRFFAPEKLKAHLSRLGYNLIATLPTEGFVWERQEA